MSTDSNVERLIVENSAQFGLDSDLVKAIIDHESGGNTWAYRFEPQFTWTLSDQQAKVIANSLLITLDTEIIGEKTSWGLMQIMGATARDRGYSGLLTELLKPENGILYGCKHLAFLRNRYNDKIQDYVAAYNAGGVVRLITGNYRNQDYVNKVMMRYDEIKRGK